MARRAGWSPSGDVDQYVEAALRTNALFALRAEVLLAAAVLAVFVVRAITRAQARHAA